MLIDWFTVLAQVLNFVILVWLMKHYLYKPILNAIDTHEKTIAKQLSDADKITKDAKEEKNQFSLKSQNFEIERAALLKKATDDANAEALRLTTEAKKNVLDINAKGQAILKTQQQNLSQMLVKRSEQEVLNITRKVLKDLADAKLEERIVNVFIKHLSEMPKEKRTQITSEIKSSNQQMAIRSTFQLSTDQRNLVEAAIKETLNDKAEFNFEISETLISGIELTTNGQKLSWSIADYVNSLEKTLSETLIQNSPTLKKLEKSPSPLPPQAVTEIRI